MPNETLTIEQVLTLLAETPRRIATLTAGVAPDRSRTVTGAGKVLERDVLFYGRWLAGHERVHVKQIGRIVTTMQT